MVGSRRGGGRADAKHDRVRAATWRVRVRDAVGLVAVGDLQLVVQPKIPRSHLLYLLAEAEAIPRLDEQRGALAAGLSLWELIALWFLDAAEHVLRLDLIRDYTPVEDELQLVRGRLAVLPTGRAYYQGRISLFCEYDDFRTDTPLNRVVRAGAEAVARSGVLSWSVRRRALRLVMRMDEVGPLESDDLRVRLDRRTAHYADALAPERAMDEYDRIGQEAFLDKYGFHPAKRFMVVRDGRRYDSKAIFGAAWGYQSKTRGRCRPATLLVASRRSSDSFDGSGSRWKTTRVPLNRAPSSPKVRPTAGPTSERHSNSVRLTSLLPAACSRGPSRTPFC